MHTSDEQLVKKATGGSKRAVEFLYERYVTPVFRFFWYQLHDEKPAQDLTSDVFIEMIHSLKSYSRKGSFKSWLYAIARYKLYAYLRDKYKYPTQPLPDQLPDANNRDGISSEREVQNNLKERSIQHILKRLTKEEQRIVSLIYLQKFSSREAGGVTGRTPESVRVILHRALKKLRTYYESSKK